MPPRTFLFAAFLYLPCALLGQSTSLPQTMPPQPASTADQARSTAPVPVFAARPKLSSETVETSGVHSSHVMFFYTVPSSAVVVKVHDVPASDPERIERLRTEFRSSGCSEDQMREQSVRTRKGEHGENLVCTWPGDSSALIVVAANYEREGKGQGALAGWSGAAMLPLLFKALQGQPRQNTFVFLEAWKAAGAETWLKSLPRDERRHIRAMIDIDGMGLGDTRYYTPFSMMETPPLAASRLQTELLWAAIDEGIGTAPERTNPHHWLNEDSTDPFRALMVPTVVLHSVAPDKDRLPGSIKDVASAIDGNAYFQSYHLICTYLSSLDHVASRLDAEQDPFWKAVPYQDAQPDDETPRVTFRHLGGTMRH